MKQILDDILSQHTKGLVLLDMPTGTGKTYQVAEYIAQQIDQLKAQNRKIIFITHLKKNLPFKELEKQLGRHGNADYRDEVWFVQGKLDAFKDHFSTYIDDIKRLFPSFKPYELLSLLKEYEQATKNGQSTLIGVLEKSSDKPIKDFSNLVKRRLHKEFKTPELRLDALKNNSDWQWVTKLFPATLTLDKPVLFMSVSKFIYPYDTLIQSPMTITELLADYQVTLFIDEIDASKHILQDFIIKQGLRNPIDLVYTVKQIGMTLSNSQFSDELLPPHKLDKQPDDPATIQQNLQEKSLTVNKDFNLSLSLKSRDKSQQSSFIFYDKKPLYLANAQYKVLTLTADEAKGTVWIDVVKKTTEHDESNTTLGGLLATCSQTIGYFKGGIHMLANNYHANYRFDGITYDNAVRSYLNFFNFKDSSFDNLVYEIQYARLTSTWKQKNLESDADKNDPLRFHENGFSYHTIIDSDDNVSQSIVDTYSFPYSPEALLLDWCRNFMVVGISATANLRSRLGNYDLHYLRKRLNASSEADFVQLNSEQKQRLSDQFTESTCYYRQTYMQVTPHGLVNADDEITIKDEFINLFGGQESEDIVQDLFNKAPIKDENNRPHYLKQFYKIFQLWKAYHQQQINAFLVLFSKGYYEELDFLRTYCNILSQHLGLPDTAKEEMVCVVGNTSENALEGIKTRLSQGERRFVISTYATLGAGVNIQYPIPSKFAGKLVKTNHRPPNDNMDFDGLYLDKPTKLISYLDKDKDNTQHSLVNLIFQLEYLKLSGLSLDSFEKHLQKAFSIYSGSGHYKSVEKLSKFDDFKAYMMQVLIQAIGRICRTNMKCPKIQLHIDNALLDHWFDDFGTSQMLPEFHKINAFIKEQNAKPNIIDSAVAQQDFETVRRFIEKMKYKIAAGNITIDDVHQWQGLRDFVLKNPQKLNEIISPYDFLYINFEEPKTSYYYSCDEDDENFILLKQPTQHCYTASSASARLDRLMQHTGIYEHFIQKGYAIQLAASRHWLQPILFNNIYKGALGEIAGSYLWHSYDLPNLSDLPTKDFERFDFLVDDGIYVDFKNWSPTLQDGEAEREKIYYKMEKTGAKLVFIINIVADSNQYRPLNRFPHPTKGNEQLIVELPYFTLNDNTADMNQINIIHQLIEEYQAK